MFAAAFLLLVVLPHHADPVPYPEPELACLSFLPDADTASAQRSLAMAVRDRIYAQIRWRETFWLGSADLKAALDYPCFCWDVWDDLCRARDPTREVYQRVHYLGTLRAKIGERAFAEGRLPLVWENFPELP